MDDRDKNCREREPHPGSTSLRHGLKKNVLELVPRSVFCEKDVDTKRALERRKLKMEKTLRMRRHTEKFCEIFVDGSPRGTDALLVPNAMNLMDEIRGWEDEECWIHTKDPLTRGQIPREQEEHLKKRKVSIMLPTKWFGARAFGDHERKSLKTIIQQDEKFYTWHWISKIDVPCVL